MIAMTGTEVVAILNVVGTIVFALSGAAAGVHRRLDFFGVLVLAFVTAVAGGMLRDVLLGAVPPEAIRHWHMAALAVVAGAFVFFFPGLVERLRHPVLLLDAAGLGVFAATGTQKALAFGIPPVMAVVLGMVTAVGGGMLRDVLTAQTPIVLCSDIYAVAALLGGAVVAMGLWAGLPAMPVLLTGVLLCFGLRLVAIRRQWSLPQSKGHS